MRSENPLVSVWMTTYNHAKYIRQCLESVISQKTNFTFEVIVGEDCSTDHTREIIKEFEAKYPDIIKPIYHAQNVGMIRNGFEFCYPALKGKYIACLEGDDYWCDNNKLQKQINFLEANKDYAICFHRVYLLENEKKPVINLYSPKHEATYTIEDLAKENFVHTASIVCRNESRITIPTWLYDSPVSDYPFLMLSAKHGKLKYFPEPMSVYRFHDGIWASQSLQIRIKKYLRVLSFLLKEDFNEKVIEILKQQYKDKANEYLQSLLPDLDKLTHDLKKLSEESPELIYDWATKFYPDYINNITGSRSFKLAKRAASIRNKLKL